MIKRSQALVFQWIGALDQILRGQTTSVASIRRDDFVLPVGGLTIILIALAMIYGACMGVFSLVNPQIGGFTINQLLSSSIKMPMLFLLTLVVTLPSLYVFNALVGSALSMWSLVKLITSTMAVMLATLASFGPIVAFFSVTTRSYGFIVLLNVVACAMAGVLGLMFLLQTLHRLTVVLDESLRQGAAPGAPPASQSPPQTDDDVVVVAAVDVNGDVTTRVGANAKAVREPGPLDLQQGHVLAGHTRRVFVCWIIVFGLVGSQMSWVLRPFIGNPTTSFAFLRAPDSNFFEAVWNVIFKLFEVSR